MILTHKQEVLEHIGETSSSIYDKAYQQGRVDAIDEMNILGLVNFKVSDNPIKRKMIVEIDFDDCLNSEQIIAIMLEQLKEQTECCNHVKELEKKIEELEKEEKHECICNKK